MTSGKKQRSSTESRDGKSRLLSQSGRRRLRTIDMLRAVPPLFRVSLVPNVEIRSTRLSSRVRSWQWLQIRGNGHFQGTLQHEYTSAWNSTRRAPSPNLVSIAETAELCQELELFPICLLEVPSSDFETDSYGVLKTPKRHHRPHQARALTRPVFEVQDTSNESLRLTSYDSQASIELVGIRISSRVQECESIDPRKWHSPAVQSPSQFRSTAPQPDCTLRAWI